MDRPQATVSVVPASTVPWADVIAVFGARGAAHRCQCQRYKLARRETFAAVPVEDRAERLRQQTAGDSPHGTSGVVAYVPDGTPVGWCAVEPRPEYGGLVRHARVPWVGRDEDPTDPSVWCVTCVLVRAGHRRRGIGHALVRAAVDRARDGGASAVEGYPILTTEVVSEELHVGTRSMFAAAGFTEVSRPTPRRAVMRIGLGRPDT